MMEGEWGGLLQQCCNAKAAGATEEEIMEVAFIANYSVSKHMLVGTGGDIGQGVCRPDISKYKKTGSMTMGRKSKIPS